MTDEVRGTPGWQATDDAMAPLHPTQTPLHWRPIIHRTNAPAPRAMRAAPFWALGLALAAVSGCDLLRTELAGREERCSKGDAAACNDLGVSYERGEGAVPRDLGRARTFYQKACDGRLARGCFNLALTYEPATAAELDEPAAVGPFQKACDLGYAPGCSRLGFHYGQGSGVAKDSAKAAQLFQKGCDGGSADGCVRLGLMYGIGKDIPRDLARAAQLFQKGCDGGDQAGCCFVGDCLAEGLGVPKDLAKATQFFRKACDGGVKQCCEKLEKRPDR